jgi:hemolysin activation/secretion protein
VSLLAKDTRTRGQTDATAFGHGENVQVSPRFTSDIAQATDWQISLQGGYDYKSSNNNFLYGGSLVTQGASRISQFEAAVIAAQTDGWGRTDASLSGFASPGGMLPGNADINFRSLSSAARANYLYGRLEVTRQGNLPSGLTLWTHGVGQLASHGLLPTEQLNAGGVTSVRGYPTSTLRGDAGVMLSAELRLAPAGLGDTLGTGLGEKLSPFLFVDYAAVKARGDLGAEDGNLASFGPGLRITLDQPAELVLDGGHQVRMNGGHHYPGQFFDLSVAVRY